MTRIMTGLITTVRNREHVKIHWLPFIWATSFMILILIFFCVLWDMKVYFDKVGINWTWDYYGPQALHAVFIFLGAGLVLPVSREANTDCLLQDYSKHGKLALIPLLASHLLAWPMNMYMDNVPLFDEADYLNVFAIAIIVVGFKVTRLTWQIAAATIYLLILMYGMLFVWSRPGHSSLDKYKPADDPRIQESAYQIPLNQKKILPKSVCGIGFTASPVVQVGGENKDRCVAVTEQCVQPSNPKFVPLGFL